MIQIDFVYWSLHILFVPNTVKHWQQLSIYRYIISFCPGRTITRSDPIIESDFVFPGFMCYIYLFIYISDSCTVESFSAYKVMFTLYILSNTEKDGVSSFIRSLNTGLLLNSKLIFCLFVSIEWIFLTAVVSFLYSSSQIRSSSLLSIFCQQISDFFSRVCFSFQQLFCQFHGCMLPSNSCF